MQDQLTLATLSATEFYEEAKNIRELMALLNTQESNTIRSLQLTREMLSKATNCNERKYHMKRKLDLLAMLEDIDARKARLNEESDRLREEAQMKRQRSTTNERAEPPNNMSVVVTADDTTMNLSLSHSGSSTKKPKRSLELVVLM